MRGRVDVDLLTGIFFLFVAMIFFITGALVISRKDFGEVKYGAIVIEGKRCINLVDGLFCEVER